LGLLKKGKGFREGEGRKKSPKKSSKMPYCLYYGGEHRSAKGCGNERKRTVVTKVIKARGGAGSLGEVHRKTLSIRRKKEKKAGPNLGYKRL